MLSLPAFRREWLLLLVPPVALRYPPAHQPPSPHSHIVASALLTLSGFFYIFAVIHAAWILYGKDQPWLAGIVDRAWATLKETRPVGAALSLYTLFSEFDLEVERQKLAVFSDKSGIQIDLPPLPDCLVSAADFFYRMVNGAISLLDSSVESTGKLLHWIVGLELPPSMEEEDVRGEDSLSDGSSNQQPPPVPEYVGGNEHGDEVLRTLSAAAQQIEREQAEKKEAEGREAAAADEDDGERERTMSESTLSLPNSVHEDDDVDGVEVEAEDEEEE